MNSAGVSGRNPVNGFVTTGLEIARNEGATALYKGFTPICCRKVVWVTAFFVSYERLRVIFVVAADS